MKSSSLPIASRQKGKDLIIYIAKSKFGNRWKTRERFVTGAKIEYGGPVGYELKIETP